MMGGVRSLCDRGASITAVVLVCLILHTWVYNDTQLPHQLLEHQPQPPPQELPLLRLQGSQQQKSSPSPSRHLPHNHVPLQPVQPLDNHSQLSVSHHSHQPVHDHITVSNLTNQLYLSSKLQLNNTNEIKQQPKTNNTRITQPLLNSHNIQQSQQDNHSQVSQQQQQQPQNLYSHTDESPYHTQQQSSTSNTAHRPAPPTTTIHHAHPTFSATCYTYHANLTAENLCCQMVNFTDSLSAIHGCFRRAIEDITTTDSTTEGGNRDKGSSSSTVRWAIFGDSHMRYLFTALVIRLQAPSLQYRLGQGQEPWMLASLLPSMMLASKFMHSRIELRDLSVPFHLTFQWDPYLDRIKEEMMAWETRRYPTPSLVIVAGALHWMLRTQELYIEQGAAAAAGRYGEQLASLAPHLSHLASRTTVVFKLLDDLRRASEPNTTKAINTRSNYPLYNQEALRSLAGTGVVMWDSTVPLSLGYTRECDVQPRDTRPNYYWKCSDPGHVGYIIVNQYADMVLNHYCGRYLGASSGFCT